MCVGVVHVYESVYESYVLSSASEELGKKVIMSIVECLNNVQMHVLELCYEFTSIILTKL